MKRRMFVCLLLMLAVALSAAGATVAFAVEQSGATAVKENFLTEEKMTFVNTSLAEGKVTFDTSTVERMHSRVATGTKSIEMKYSLTGENLSGWVCQMIIFDELHATGAASWERNGESSAYIIWFNANGFAMGRADNGGNMTGADSYACTMTGDHTLNIDIDSDVANTTVVITVKLDGQEILKRTDTAAVNADDISRGITFLNQAGQATTVVSELNVYEPEAKADEPLFADTEVADAMADVELLDNTEKQDKNIAFKATGDAAIVKTAGTYSQLKLKTELKIDTANKVNDDQWLAFIAFIDQTPGVAPWVAGAAGKRYILGFYETKIELARYDAGNATVLGDPYTVDASFYGESHVYNIMVTELGEGRLRIRVNIDDGATEIDYTEEKADVFAKIGGVTVLLNAGNKISGTMTKFAASAAEKADVPIESDFFERNEDVAVTDFTSLVQGDIEENWTGTMNEADFAGDVTFYKGGKKDNINLGGVNIVTAATKHNLTASADFILNFKLTVNWGKRDGDWGTLITFRDNNAGVPMWDGSSGNVSRKCYALRFDRNASNEDDTTSGTMSILRYDSNSVAVPLGEKTRVELNGKEIEYKVGIVNVDEDEDGTVDYVWFCVMADGVVVLEYKDNTENKIADNGGMMIIKHNTRTCTIRGISEGEACEEYVVGGNGGNTGDGDGDDPDKDPGDNDNNGDNTEPENTGKKKKCGSSAGATLPLAAAMIISAAGIMLGMRKRKER